MEHEFYHLDDAAGLLECTELDLLKWGMTGKIELCIWYRGQLDRFTLPDDAFTGRPAPEKNEMVDELLAISKRDIKKFIIPRESRSNGKIEIDQIMWPGCNYPLYLLEENIFKDDGDTQIIEIKENDLYITDKTFNILKAELSKSLVELGTPPPYGDEIAAILDPDHPWHSELLAIAVKGWLEIYSKHEGNSSDNTHKPPGGHIAMIKEWLSKQNSSLLTKHSTGYTAKVINPDKHGGPSKT